MCLLFPFAPAFHILEKNQLESGTGLAAKKEEEAEGLSNLIGAISPDTSAVTVLSIVHGPPTTPSPALPCPHTHCCRACWFPKTEKPEDFAPWNPVCIVYALWLPGEGTLCHYAKNVIKSHNSWLPVVTQGLALQRPGLGVLDSWSRGSERQGSQSG